MVIFCLYEGSESASLDLAQSLTTQSNASTWTLDCKGEAFFLTSELKRYDEQRHDGWTVNNYDDDQEGSSCHLRRVSSLVRDHQASFAQGDRFTGSSTISEIVSEDSLEFIGPHSKSYTVELERLSKQASAFLLPSQGTALRLMPKESVPPVSRLNAPQLALTIRRGSPLTAIPVIPKSFTLSSLDPPESPVDESESSSRSSSTLRSRRRARKC